MTPTETAATLRRYNEWRLGDEYLPQPDTEQITAAIYAAVEMIERLKKVESAAQNLVNMKGRHNTEVAYQRLVAALEETK